MSEFLAVLAFSLSVTGPIFVVLALGVWLRRIGMVDDGFVEKGSRLVFNISLPVLLFLSVASTHIGGAIRPGLIGFGLLGTLAVYLLLEWIARAAVEPARDRGVFVQGAFRANMGIVGLAYCMNAYGEAGVATASLFVGFVTILFNILAILTLSRSLQRGSGPRHILRGVLTNPLIIGIVAALPLSWLGIPLPKVLAQAGHYVAGLTLPLALLCTGAALDFQTLRQELRNTAGAAAAKLLGVPLVFALGGVALGFRGMELGVLMLLTSAPSAAASYVMTRAMGGNDTLAANIIALTTVGSILTTALWVMVLRGLGLM